MITVSIIVYLHVCVCTCNVCIYIVMYNIFHVFERYESFWPVFGKDAQGVIMVYNPGNSKHEKEIEKW